MITSQSNENHMSLRHPLLCALCSVSLTIPYTSAVWGKGKRPGQLKCKLTAIQVDAEGRAHPVSVKGPSAWLDVESTGDIKPNWKAFQKRGGMSNRKEPFQRQGRDLGTATKFKMNGASGGKQGYLKSKEIYFGILNLGVRFQSPEWLVPWRARN